MISFKKKGNRAFSEQKVSYRRNKDKKGKHKF
jgi:hypothetical protein